MRSFWQDVRLGLRLLRTSPGFAASCILTLVLGVLLNTAVFGVVNALWFGKLPFRDDREIAVVRTAVPGAGSAGVSWADYQGAAAQAPGLAAVAAFSSRTYNVAAPGPNAAPAQASGGMLSWSALAVLGFDPVLGRGFTAEEEGSYAEADGPAVVLIGEGFWKRRLGGAPDVIGRRIRLDGATAVIVGVLPKSFRFVYAGYDVLAPISRDITRAPRSERPLQVLARLRPAAPLEAVNRQLETVSRRASGDKAGEGVLRATPYRDAVFAEAFRMYPVLMAAALLLLLLVCANLSNLFLARMAARGRELAIRAALGAGRARVIRQVVTEAAVPAVLAAGMSMGLAVWLRNVLVARVPELAVFAIDWRVALYTIGAAMLAGIACGAAPAFEAARPGCWDRLKAGGLAESPSGSRLRRVLMVSQVAVSLMLVTGTGFLIRSMASLRQVDRGVDLKGVVCAGVELRGARYAQPEQRLRFWERLSATVAQTHGVEAAGVAGAIPLTNVPGGARVEIEGQPAAEAGQTRIARSVADPGYRSTVRLRMIAGRPIGAADRSGAPRVVNVNESFARHYWPAHPGDAVGRRIRVDGGEWTTIAGVVSDARQFLMFPAAPEVIAPVAQSPRDARALIVRAPGLSAEAVREAVRTALREIDPDIPAGDFLTEDAIVEMFYPKVMVVGLGALAAVALALASVGLCGVIAFLAARRTREFGIRMALGASPRSIARQVAGQGMRVVAVGVAIGSAGALALGRALRMALVDVRAFDPLPLAVSVAVVFSVAILALAAPAIRAARIHPSDALRAE